MSAETQDRLLRTASTSVVKAGVALALMAAFFILFFLMPGVTAAGALLLVVGFELFRRR
jgi:hypothetical protein